MTEMSERNKALWGHITSQPVIPHRDFAPVAAAAPFLQGVSSPRAQALEEAAQVADKGNTGWLKKRDVTANKKEARDYETMAIACSHVAAAIRAISSQPVADALPQDVINLVIAAREFWDDYNNFSDESKSLDKALEAFASRVPYENEPDDLPSSPGASE